MRLNRIIVLGLILLVSSGKLFAQNSHPIRCGTVWIKEAHVIGPSLESRVHYPELAKEKGLEVNVTFQATIEKDSSVGSLKILWPRNDTIFTPEVVRVIKAARFAPALKEGIPIEGSITSTIHFRLNQAAKKN